MADPVVQAISDELVTRLGEITTENGYEFTAGTVQLLDRDTNAFQPHTLDIVIDQKESVRNDELSCPGNPPRMAMDVQFQIDGYASSLDTDTCEIAIVDRGTTDNQMLSAILLAITDNGSSSWHTFDGNAITARIDSATTMDAPGHDGGTVVLTVTYRTSELDPYTRM